MHVSAPIYILMTETLQVSLRTWRQNGEWD